MRNRAFQPDMPGNGARQISARDGNRHPPLPSANAPVECRPFPSRIAPQPLRPAPPGPAAGIAELGMAVEALNKLAGRKSDGQQP